MFLLSLSSTFYFCFGLIYGIFSLDSFVKTAETSREGFVFFFSPKELRVLYPFLRHFEVGHLIFSGF